MKPIEIHKELSANDVGLTGGHQSGILIPKSIISTEFFPSLPSGVINPRTKLKLSDRAEDAEFNTSLIHYNGRELGHSTRSEFRLTGISSYLRVLHAKVGDTLVFKSTSDANTFEISISRPGFLTQNYEDKVRISLSGNWTTIKLGRNR